jgi:hypothetical protein
MTESFTNAIEDSKARLRELIIQRDQIDVHIEHAKNAIVALAYMLNDPSDTEREISAAEDILGRRGLTEAIRRVLQESAVGMTPVEVRDTLANSGMNLLEYSNPLAAIHTVLKRLVKARDVKPATTNGNETVYQWNGIKRFPRLRETRRGSIANIARKHTEG